MVYSRPPRHEPSGTARPLRWQTPACGLLLALTLSACLAPETDALSPADAGHKAEAPAHREAKTERSRQSPARRASADEARRAITGQWASARLRRVQDGDSLIIQGTDGLDYTLRLSGIDAPERSQPFANRARQHLQSLTRDRRLHYLAVKRDPYGRLVALLRTGPLHERKSTASEPVDVNRAMLDAGLAWYFKRYESDLPHALRAPYQAAEAGARKAGRGLWSEPDPLPPWAFRQQQREKQLARKRTQKE